ncbi:MAG: 4Fe-4S dicluster domain-containing protein [Anaerolineae bacterium]
MRGSFINQINDRSGQTVQLCYHCHKCTAGCPTAYVMDYKPDQILRLVQLGQKDRVLNSSAIWMCVSCDVCGTRCPNQIRLAPVMGALRHIALEEGYSPEPAVYALHRSFLDSIRLWGRVHELSMLMAYKLRSRDLFSDLALGMNLIWKGKLSFLPKRVKGLDKVKKLYKESS